MPKLILKSPYLKSNKASVSRGGYLRYIATRQGVELIPKDAAQRSASCKQKALIQKLLKDFPESKELFEYGDYLRKPTMANASEFITMAIDMNVGDASGSETYARYIATRPGVELHGTHGLFSDEPVLSLEAAVREIDEHEGIVWTHIISLQREDAVRLGFDNAEAWKNLLKAKRNTIAEAMKIPPHELRWYAAFHNTTHHPHVHMMVYSADPRKGYLTKEGIKRIRSELTNTVFRDEMYVLYEQKSEQRDELVQQARQGLSKLIAAMQSGEVSSPSTEQKLLALSEKLRHTEGKKVYGYLKAPVKLMIDEIVDELAEIPAIADAYEKWQELQSEITLSYQSTPPEKLPLSRRKEFKAIKNAVIREAMLLIDGGVFLKPAEEAPAENEPKNEETSSAPCLLYTSPSPRD